MMPLIMARHYLFVSPEEYAEVHAAGALWDDESKCWYLPSAPSDAFSRWSEEPAGDDPYRVVSDAMTVAMARGKCGHCGAGIEMICLYGREGMDIEMEEILEDFTLSKVWAVDDGLAAQLAAWPQYRKGEEGVFSNYCPVCGAVQEDYLLHSKPGDVFFGLSRAEPDTVTFVPLEGVVLVGGDMSFEI